MKILTVGHSIRTEGQTDRRADMTKLIVDFHNFAKATKM